MWNRFVYRFSISLLTSIVVLLIISPAFYPARGTTVVPVPEQALIEDAIGIVIGRVTLIESYWDAGQEKIFTHISLSVEEKLKGDFDASQLILKQVGGQVSGLHSWIYGTPEFTTGEKVLIFLSRNSDGTLRVAHLYQGKFSIFFDTNAGEEFAYRETPAGVQVLSAPSVSQGAGPQNYEIHALKDYKNRIRELGRQNSQSTLQAHSSGLVLLPLPSSTQTEIQDRFTFLGTPSRWFEPDSLNAVPISINSAGEPLAPSSGFDQVRAAIQAWSTVTRTNFRFRDAGFTPAVGFRFDGVNAVSFRDALAQIDNPVGCSGTLAIGGGFFDPNQSITVNGQEFKRMIEGDVVFNDGWNGCGFYENFANFAEVATHELGHVLGLGHSADTDATMFGQAHFDGRGAALRQDDIDGLRFIYPGTGLVITSLTAGRVSPQPQGSTIVFTASTSGGTAPIQFKWWVYNGTAWSLAQDWSTSNTFSWAPTVPGTYRVGLWVRSNGNPVDASENGAFASVNFTITGLTITSLTADKISPQPQGTTILFTATTSGGRTPIQFKWWIYNGVAWSLAQDWSTSNTFSWAATVPGTYRVGLWVRSNANPVDASENGAFATLNFTITGLTITSLTADRVSPQPQGTTINFTATTSGGIAPVQFKWWIYDGVRWSLARDWSTSNTFSWAATVPGTYRVGLWVRSNGNTVDATENGAFAAVNFTITGNLTIASLTADKTSPQPQGTPIVFTATTSGGLAPIQFKWWIYDGVGWSLARDWSTSNTFSWTPTVPGNYRVGLWVRSNGNTVDASENGAFATRNFTITGNLTITSLTADRVSPQPQGTTINFTATTSGGLAPIQFKWWIYDGVRWSLARDWSTSNTFSWTPTVPGNYRVGLWVRSNGNTVDATENGAFAAVNLTITGSGV